METYLNGTSSKEENYYLFKWYDSFQEGTPERKTPAVGEEDALFSKIQSKISVSEIAQENGSFKLKTVKDDVQSGLWWAKAAAAVALISSLLTGAYFYRNYLPVAEKTVRMVTNSTQKRRTTLPDGTLVWLNVNSKLSYASLFNGKQREVWLIGEAYFEVKHNAKRPFVVHTANLSVKDLGTIFNLKAYPNRKTETSLIQGSIAIALNHQVNTITLKPYQKLVLDHAEKTEPAAPVHLENIPFQEDGAAVAEIGWIHQEFGFNNERFEDILPVLEKRFGVQLVIKNPKVKDYRFTGRFKDAGLNTVLNALRFSNEFEYRKEGEKAIVIY